MITNFLVTGNCTLCVSELVNEYSNTRQFASSEKWGYDLNNSEAVSFSIYDSVPEGVVAYPYKEDLISFGELVEDFLYEKNLPIPHSHYADFLRENDLYYEFQEYQANRQWHILKQWLVAHGINP